MKFIINLRHFESGNADVAKITEIFENKFSFLEHLADTNLPISVKIKHKGKNINGYFNAREDEFHMRISFKLSTGDDFTYETEGYGFDDCIHALKKGTKENASQQITRRQSKPKNISMSHLVADENILADRIDVIIEELFEELNSDDEYDEVVVD